MRYWLITFKVLILLIMFGLVSCRTEPSFTMEGTNLTETIQGQIPTQKADSPITQETPKKETMIPEDVQPEPDKPLADVISVETTGDPNRYSFSVGISSPDTGCEQYADWWEVITPEGELIYRRILLHSHVSEQPFVRSGGPVEIEQDREIIIRAHMNPGGYGGKAFKGSVKSGFIEVNLEQDFGGDLENQDPLPSGCNF